MVGTHLGSCCGIWNVGSGTLTMPEFTGVATTVLVVVLIIEMEGVVKVLSGRGEPGRQSFSVTGQLGRCTSSRTVVMSLALITKTREASLEASREIAPGPTAMVPVSRSPTTSMMLTRLPVQLAARPMIVVWFTGVGAVGQLPSAA